MFPSLLPVGLAAAALSLPGLVAAAESVSGEVPATKHQLEVFERAPANTTTRSPEAQGTTVQDLPVSPHQGQVLEEVDKRFVFFDIDQDNSISASEAAASPELESQWTRLDSNQDDRLDKSEFSVFEPNNESQP